MQGNVVGFSWWETLQYRPLASGVVNVNRVGAASDDIGKLPCCQYVVGCKLVVPHNSASLPHANLYPALDDIGVPKPRHITLQKVGYLTHLAAGLKLSVGQVPHICPQHLDDAGGVDTNL